MEFMMSRILVVDDDKTLLDTYIDGLEQIMGSEQHKFDAATSVSSAIEKASLYEYDLVITDIDFTSTNEGEYAGLELLDFVKSKKNTLVILMPQHNRIKYAFDGAKKGAEGLYSKEASVKEYLIPLINSLLKQEGQIQKTRLLLPTIGFLVSIVFAHLSGYVLKKSQIITETKYLVITIIGIALVGLLFYRRTKVKLTNKKSINIE